MNITASWEDCEDEWAVSRIVALAAGADGQDVRPGDVLGYSLDSMIVYLDRDASLDDPEDEVARYAALWQVPPTRGYHLAKLERRNRTQYDRCRWNGFCKDRGDTPCVWDGSCVPPDTRYARSVEFVRAAWHESYGRCLEAFPEAARCTVVDVTNPSELEANGACYELERQFAPPTECELPASHIANPDEFSSSATVTMGATFYDLYL